MSLFLPLPLTLQLTQSSFPTRCPHLPLLVFQPSSTSLLLDQVTIFSFSSFLTSASPPPPDCPSHFKNVASLSLPLFIWTGKIIIVSDSKDCYEGGLCIFMVRSQQGLVFSILAVSLLLLSSSSQSSLFLMPSTGYLRGIG